MKSKKRSNTPRHKRLNRVSRLQAAKHWMPKYEGKNIVKGYSTHFGVDKLCAVKELEVLGYKIDTEYINRLKVSLIERQKFVERKDKIKEEKRLLAKYLEDERQRRLIGTFYGGGSNSDDVLWFRGQKIRLDHNM